MKGLLITGCKVHSYSDLIKFNFTKNEGRVCEWVTFWFFLYRFYSIISHPIKFLKYLISNIFKGFSSRDKIKDGKIFSSFLACSLMVLETNLVGGKAMWLDMFNTWLLGDFYLPNLERGGGSTYPYAQLTPHSPIIGPKHNKNMTVSVWEKVININLRL